MGHELDIDITTGKAFAAFANPAWHDLGYVPDDPAKREAGLTLDEAITESKCDINYSKQPIYLANGRLVKDSFAVVRDDTGNAVSVVGNDYKILQPRDCFEYMRSMFENHELIIESLFALKGGSMLCLLARMPEHIEIIPGDKIYPYMAFTNYHTGRAAENYLTAVRQVCWNTQSISIAEARRENRVSTMRHSGNLDSRLDKLRSDMLDMHNVMQQFKAQAIALQNVETTRESATEYVNTLFPAPKELDGSKRASTVYDAKIAELRQAYSRTAAQLPAVRGTWWGLYNSITNYVDHGQPARQSKDLRERAENHYIKTMSGTGAQLKDRAFTLALQMAGIEAIAA